MLLMSLGAGTGCDTQFLFSDDILGESEERIPRHAKAYRNFLVEYQRLQNERIAAFKEYVADVNEGRFPADSNLLKINDSELVEFERSL
ncbi:MAG: 3-methyl-2-oxobutanoate hydroxymethyltransferase [Yoonia sp.]|jgi:3-methyl-2-oxobutanoate hydroxymethyltransferase